ncbi:hypothetical protein ACX80B_17340 [Arthrobacter monumenti]
MNISDVKWNEEARQKILNDADRALQVAAREAAQTLPDADRDTVYEFLVEKLEGQFVDFKPGPDLGDYADAIVAKEITFDG